MNRINQLFATRGQRKLFSLYFCAGCPTLDATADVILSMQRHKRHVIRTIAQSSAMAWI